MTERTYRAGAAGPSEDTEAATEALQGGMKQGTDAPTPPDQRSGWLIVRRDGTIVTAERRACSLLGAPDADALTGRDWASLLPFEGAPREARLALVTGGSWAGRLVYRYARDEVPLETVISPVSRSTDLCVVSLAPSPSHAPPGTPESAAPAERASGERPARPRHGEPERATPPTHRPPLAPPREAFRPEGAAERDEHVLSAQLEVHEALHDVREAGAAARAVLQALQPAVPFDWGAVMRFEGEDVVVLATYPSPMAGVATGTRWTPPSDVEALVYASGEPALEGDVAGRAEGADGTGDTSPLSRLPAFGLRSRVILPLYAGSRVAGIMALYRGGTRGFDAYAGMSAERTVRRLGEVLGSQEDTPDTPVSTTPDMPAIEKPASDAGVASTPRVPERVEDPALEHPAPRVVERAPADDLAPGHVHDSEPPSAPPEPVTPSGSIPEHALHASRLESLGELVAGVAHELNNPLTAILGYAQIVSSLEDAERERALRTIEAEAHRASRIVRNLLAFARQRPSERRPTDIEGVLRRIIDLRRYSLEVDDVRVITRFGHVPPVRVDEGQFEQVFLNLLSNAHQALQASGGEVQISTWTRDGYVYISFADDGPGVPEALRSRVFDPFFTTREVGAGEGMGLSIVYGVVTNHGGRTWVESSPSGGANVIVQVPLEAGEASETGRAATSPPPRTAPVSGNGAAAPARARVEGLRILVVDDEAPVRALTQEILSSQGYQVVTAENGQTALRLLEAQDYGLVITDLRMPGLSGADLYHEIQQRWPQLRQRVLFVTGDIEGDRGGRALDREQVRYLEKPFTTQDLLGAIRGILNGTAGAS